MPKKTKPKAGPAVTVTPKRPSYMDVLNCPDGRFSVPPFCHDIHDEITKLRKIIENHSAINKLLGLSHDAKQSLLVDKIAKLMTATEDAIAEGDTAGAAMLAYALGCCVKESIHHGDLLRIGPRLRAQEAVRRALATGQRTIQGKTDKRDEDVLKQAKAIWKANPRKSPSAVAKQIADSHNGLKRYSKRTLYNILKEHRPGIPE